MVINMKKKKICFIVLILTLTSSLIFVNYNKKDDDIFDDVAKIKKNDDTLSIMLETEAKSGIYEKSSSGNWPDKGYKFNAKLSRCDNGGELSWDNEKKTVLMSADSINKCYVYFDLNSQTLAEYVMAQYTGVQGENAMYYHDSSLTNGANDNSYRYAGPDYVLTDKAKNAGYTSVLSNFNDSYQSNLIGIFKNNREYDYVLYDISASTNGYKVKYDEDADYMSYYDTFKKAYNDGYIDYNVKNYVCYGSDESPCPTNNLYRIIGVFDDKNHGIAGEKLVKLIKWEFANTPELGTETQIRKVEGSYEPALMDTYKGIIKTNDLYYWNTNFNQWNDSTLNTINLNTNFINYLNNINSKWGEWIETVNWHVAGNDNMWLQYYNNAAKTYNYEIVNPAVDDLKSYDDSFDSPISARVGLMYINDYAFAVDPSCWTDALNDYRYDIRENWMFIGNYEWTITRDSSDAHKAFYINEQGTLNTYTVYQDGMVNVRPAFFLKASVAYESGIGTMEDPIRLS